MMTQNKLINSAAEILTVLGIKYYDHGDRFSFPCPIHGGDNPTGVSLYKNTGCWVCFTRGCQEDHGKNFLSLIRKCLKKQKGKMVTYDEAKDFCKDFSSDDFEYVQPEDMKQFNIFTEETVIDHKLIRPEWYNTNVVVPSKYFLGREYSTEILERYNVGYCSDRYNELYQRAVVPLYDLEGDNIVGMTARTLNPHCLICKQYHPIGTNCVSYCPKWRVSKGTKKSKIIYNFNFAKKHIEETSSAIIVEGAPCVWRLEESGIHISLSILGTSLNDYHVGILNSIGVKNLFIASDNDEAGDKAKEKMIKDYGSYFNIHSVDLTEKDFGDMKPQEVRKTWEKYEKHINY